MTLEPWMIYLVALADKVLMTTAMIVVALLAVGAIGAISVPACADLGVYHNGENKGLAFCKRHFKTWLISLATALTITVIVPNSKVLAAMYVLPPIINSAAVQELPAELVELARAYIKDTIGNLKEKGE